MATKGAFVTVKYKLSALFGDEDLDGISEESLVLWLCKEEGVIGLADDIEGEITKVEVFESPDV